MTPPRSTQSNQNQTHAQRPPRSTAALHPITQPVAPPTATSPPANPLISPHNSRPNVRSTGPADGGEDPRTPITHSSESSKMDLRTPQGSPGDELVDVEYATEENTPAQSRRRRNLLRLWIIGTVLVHYADLATDISVTVMWFMSKDYAWASMSLIFLVLSPFILGLIIPTPYSNETGKRDDALKVALLNTFCLAPAVGGGKALKELDVNAHPSVGHSLMITKFVQATLEALPETALQAYVLTLQMGTETLTNTKTPLQLVSLGLSYFSIVTYVYAGRAGHVRGIHKEWGNERWSSTICMFLGTSFEIAARVIGLVMFATAFKVFYFIVVVVEFVAKAIIFGYFGSMTIEKGLTKIFPAITGGFFNMFVQYPGPWVTVAARSRTNQMGHRRQAWWWLMGVNFVITLVCCGLPLVPDLHLSASINQWLHGLCEYPIETKTTSTQCFFMAIPITGAACSLFSVILLSLWVREVFEDAPFMASTLPITPSVDALTHNAQDKEPKRQWISAAPRQQHSTAEDAPVRTAGTRGWNPQQNTQSRSRSQPVRPVAAEGAGNTPSPGKPKQFLALQP